MHQILNELQQLQQQMARMMQDMQAVQMKLGQVLNQAQQMEAGQRMQPPAYTPSLAPTYGGHTGTPMYPSTYNERQSSMAPSYGSRYAIGTNQMGNNMASTSQTGSTVSGSNTLGVNVANSNLSSLNPSRMSQAMSPQSGRGTGVNTSVFQSMMATEKTGLQNLSSMSASMQDTAGPGRQSEHTAYGRLI